MLDLVSWVREHNWAIVIGYKEAEYNVFDIDKTDPWRHKWVPDPGRIPARKPSVCRPRFLHKIQPMVSQVKRLLSVPGYSEDEEETSNSSDGRKRSRTTVTSHNWSLSCLLRAPLRSPSTCSPPSAPLIGRDPFSHSRNSRAHQQVGGFFSKM